MRLIYSGLLLILAVVFYSFTPQEYTTLSGTISEASSNETLIGVTAAPLDR